MPLMLTIWDTTLPGARTPGFELEVGDRTAITVRELIRQRVLQEIERYERSATPDVFVGLVQPEESERILNGYRMVGRRQIDGEEQVKRACASFEKNGFLILVNDRQVESLEQTVDVSAGAEIEFVKLVPLIGG